jgi:hypothetical protein
VLGLYADEIQNAATGDLLSSWKDTSPGAGNGATTAGIGSSDDVHKTTGLAHPEFVPAATPSGEPAVRFGGSCGSGSCTQNDRSALVLHSGSKDGYPEDILVGSPSSGVTVFAMVKASATAPASGHTGAFLFDVGTEDNRNSGFGIEYGACPCGVEPRSGVSCAYYLLRQNAYLVLLN